jgi:hypothetical protein
MKPTNKINTSLDVMVMTINDHIWALQAAKSEIEFLEKQRDQALHAIRNAYVTNDGEVLDLDTLAKRFAEYEYRFTDDHR